ncbi:MAG: hypothetical protein US37_C0007G0021 [Candidatus Moranbacteria bacterium GW2011_GWF2_37_11]|nr:MAG: hypothetical protein US37_C0007G0021 [Candidatus Moranbacteria bacterium GW2011_GWF2_37_11]
MKINFKILPIVILVIFIGLSFSNNAQAQVWQETLENNFDIAETFDELADWYGNHTDVVTSLSYPDDMPKKLDGSESIWDMYSQYYNGPNQHLDNWIGDHGEEYNWRSGKSACINYPPLYCGINIDDVKGYGSERLGIYIGDGTPQSGYHDVYVFFMMKYHDGFWALQDGTVDSFLYPPVLKMFDAVTGFKDIYNYNEPTCQTNIDHEYGTNFSIYNAGGGGISRPQKLYFLDQSNITSWDSANSCWRYAYERNVAMYDQTRFDAEYLAHKWIGVEYHLNLGTLENYDGRSEFWVYNEDGEQIGYYDSGPVRMQTNFSYNYNKFVFGGNYQCAGGAVCPGETRWYFDDLVIDNQRVGPTYFSLLNSQSIPESCTDNIQNQDETGIDCGGVCEACVGPITYGLSNFISIITNWLGIGNETSDVNSDGIVNTRDLGVMMSNWE